MLGSIMLPNTWSDTLPEIERMQFDVLRRLSEGDRLAMACQLTKQVWGLALHAYDDQFPNAEPAERLFRFLAAQYGTNAAMHWREAATALLPSHAVE